MPRTAIFPLCLLQQFKAMQSTATYVLWVWIKFEWTSGGRSHVLDSDSALVPKFFNPGPDRGSAIFLIWESDSVQTPSAIIDPTVICQCFYLRNDHTDSCYCQNGKVTPVPGSVFHKTWTPGPRPIVKCRI